MTLFNLFTLLLSFTTLPPDWQTPYEKSNGRETTTYAQCIQYYTRLDAAYDEIKLLTGSTDVSKPLRLVVSKTKPGV